MTDDDLLRRAAASLDAEPAWWPLLPDLLSGLPALGGDPAAVLEALDGLPNGARVLDLGCGAGGIAVELARRGFAVEGVDAHPGLIAEARERAVASGVASRSTFVVGDVRAYVDRSARSSELSSPRSSEQRSEQRSAARSASFDAVLLVAVDPWEADESRTARAAAELVRSGGLVVRDWEWSDDVVSAWRAAGFELVDERRHDPERVAANEADLLARIERNAAALVARDPSARAHCDAYLEAQRAGGDREVEVASSTWVFVRR